MSKSHFLPMLVVPTLLLGCGFSSAEVSFGDSVTVGVHHSAAGRTSVQVSAGSGACGAASLSLANGVDALFSRC